MFEKLIMDASFVRIDGWWKTLSTENDFLRGLAWRQVSKHGQRVAHRNSTHAYALDNTFRFIDGMTELRAVAHLGMSGGGWTEPKKTNSATMDLYG